MSETLVRLEAVSRHYATLKALDGVDLTIARGEWLAVMGPSGSGKSTLMHLLGALDTPTAGHVWVDGVEVSALDESARARFRREKVGIVFQQFHLLPQLTILENAALPALYAGVTPRQCRAAARARLQQVGLGERLDHRPNELSIGQRQRAAIARALVNEPRMILADEPTGALDSRTAMEILDLLRELHRGGATVVLVTHDHEVGEAAERIIHIRDGTTDDGVA